MLSRAPSRSSVGSSATLGVDENCGKDPMSDCRRSAADFGVSEPTMSETTATPAREGEACKLAVERKRLEDNIGQ
jgi:hypothetical protein